MKKKILLLCILLILLTGCGRKTVHSYKALEKHINKMKVYSKIDGKYYDLNLKGKYEIIDKNEYKYEKDNKQRKHREITIKIKDTDMDFTVFSDYGCEFDFDGCQIYGYIIQDNYSEKANEYYSQKYVKQFGNTRHLCETDHYCHISSKKDLDDAINYMTSFLDYLNSFDYLTIEPYHYSLSFNDNNFPINIYLDIKDNKYCYTYHKINSGLTAFNNSNEMKEYIESQLNERNIVLE